MFKGLIAGGLRVTVLPFLFAPVNLKTGLVFIFGCVIPQLLFFFLHFTHELFALWHAQSFGFIFRHGWRVGLLGTGFVCGSD